MSRLRRRRRLKEHHISTLTMSTLNRPSVRTDSLTTACAWCGSVLIGSNRWARPHQPLPRTGVSHGICPSCLAQVQAERAALR